MRKPYPCIAVLIPVLCLGLTLAYYIPSVREGVGWRLQTVWASIQYAMNPPEKAVFVPGPDSSPATPFALTPLAALPEIATATATLAPETPTLTPTLTPPPTLTPTPPPPQARLSGIIHMYQMFNNCGPANLAMALSFWGWKGDQRMPAKVLKTNSSDRNVMPYELAEYVIGETDFGAVVRMGGDLEMLKRFLAAGFPVIIERGFEGPSFDGWMGHYLVINGYDDTYQHVIAQDSYIGPDVTITYEKLVHQWLAFNYTYLVVYPFDRELEVMGILGPHADKTYNFQHAAEKAAADIKTTTGRDLYFAWFNRGTSLMYLQDYAQAATAYDAAFANYAAIPEGERPWRMMWYQTGPYFAYYYSQRYNDVINLASQTLEGMSDPVLEESYYWRGRAKAALGDTEGAIDDFRKSLKAHPGFQPAIDELLYLGEEP